ncbi:MAG TPA: putative peptide modification system cyclase [Myxococcaceae bacterium]|jgi:putative peptide modification system cyclase
MTTELRTDSTAADSLDAARPQLRTVVLADIADSTALVERLGDRAAAELLRLHDGLLIQALKQCHGQLIDRADGALTLFERPIDGLDFALRYQRGMAELGEAHRITLRARIGVHVGEVLVWNNPPDAVASGAKPVEIEGLVKPMTARLMSLALPGQILLSPTAQNLAVRAEGELGERAKGLRWLVHGRYRFKGVAAPMVVHEAGAPPHSPLRAPPSTAKAKRVALPWRLVAALAVAAAAALAALFGPWGPLRARPGLDFRTRDWVVVGNLQNLTGDARFQDALDTAFRVSLEQSRYVNVLSDLQVRDALQRMKRAGSPVDRQLGVEIALREGARALVLPTVSGIGGQVRFSAEVINPANGATVYGEAADAAGVDGVLGAMDSVVERLREKLGESVEAIQSASLPLEQVATANLEALKAYSLSNQAYADRDMRQAMALLRRAIELDPEFSMAHAKLAMFAYVTDDMPLMRRHLLLAREHPERLMPRERIYVDAHMATLESPETALERWTEFARLYPDFMAGQQNAALIRWWYYNDFKGAAGWFSQVANSHHPLRGISMQNVGEMLLGQEEVDQAQHQLAKAAAITSNSFYGAESDVFLVRRDYSSARTALTADSSRDTPGQLAWKGLRRVAWHADQGQWSEALQQLEAIERNPAAQSLASNPARFELARLRLLMETDPAAFRARVPAYLATQRRRVAAIGTTFDSSSVAHLLAGAILAARGGALKGLNAVLEEARPLSVGSGFHDRAMLWSALQAELALARGDGPAAGAAVGSIDASAPLLAHHTRLRALRRLGPRDQAERLARELCQARGRAVSEWSYGFSLLVPNLLDANAACR